MEDHNSESARRAAIAKAIATIRALIPKDLPKPNLHVLVKKSRSTKSGEFNVQKIAPEICKNFGIPTSAILDVQQRRYNFLLILSVPDELRDKILIGKPFLKTNDFSVEIRTSIPKLWRLSVSHIPHWINDDHLRTVAQMFGYPSHIITTSANLFVTTRTVVAFYDREPAVDSWPADEELQSVRVSVTEPMLLQPGQPSKQAQPRPSTSKPSPATSATSSSPAASSTPPQAPTVPTAPTAATTNVAPPTPLTDLPVPPSNDARLAELRKLITTYTSELRFVGKKTTRKKELEQLIADHKKEAESLQPGFKP